MDKTSSVVTELADSVGGIGSKMPTRLIDADVHENLTSMKDLVPYLSQPWRRIIERDAFAGITSTSYYRANENLSRPDARPEDGKPAGSSLALTKKQLLDEYPVDHAILTGQFFTPTDMYVQYEFGSALAKAYNDWFIENWLDREERFCGTICINANDPAGAAREIDRVGGHPRMVQVGLHPLPRGVGEETYHPIFEAAERHDLVIGMHVTGRSNTAIGEPPYFIEWRTCFPQHVQSQVVSLVAHGVFEKYPRLRVSIIEGGWSWLPHLLWRFDLSYRSLRAEVPWLTRMPSEYVREHFRFTSQPMEDLSSAECLRLFDQIGSDDILMFSSDYPHWDFDSPLQSLPRLPEEQARKVFYDTAKEWYRL